jgi:uncharacterized protein
VKVLEVDLQRRRIALTMKLDEAPARGRPDAPRGGSRPDGGRGGMPGGSRPDGYRPGGGPSRDFQRGAAKPPRDREPEGNGVMAEALARALKR